MVLWRNFLDLLSPASLPLQTEFGADFPTLPQVLDFLFGGGRKGRRKALEDSKTLSLGRYEGVLRFKGREVQRR